MADALEYAQDQPVPLSVRAGSPGSYGLSTNDGGIIVDLSRINDITIMDDTEQLVRVGTGATWGMVAEALGPHDMAMTTTTTTTTTTCGFVRDLSCSSSRDTVT